MKIIVALVVAFLALPALADQSCTLTIDAAGKLAGSCSSVTPAPIPAPAPTPQPAPQPTPQPAPSGCPVVSQQMVMQPMFMNGAINYVFDSNNYHNSGDALRPPGFGSAVSMGTIQVFELPKTWKDGRPVANAQIVFGDNVYGQFAVEVAFSKCKGDFDYYKSPQATQYLFGKAYQPCGKVMGLNDSLQWGQQGDFLTCTTPPGETWYLNWRVKDPACQTRACGHIFNVTGQ